MDTDMKCRGMQFEVGKTYEDEGAIRCGSKGFHSCEAPLNVWDYYSPVENRFFECVADGEIDKCAEDTKIASSQLTIKKEIGIAGLINAHIEFVNEKIGIVPDAAKIGSSGDAAEVECFSDHSVVACIGKSGKCKAPIGTWVTLAEYGKWNGEGCPCTCVKSFRIDGVYFKPDTWYTLKGGEVVEVYKDGD